MATEYLVNGPLRIGGAGTAGAVGLTLTGTNGEFDMWYRDTAAATGVMTQIPAPTGVDADYYLTLTRAGAANTAPTWSVSPLLNNRAISVVNPGFSVASATATVVGDIGTATWTAVVAPFFDNSGGSFVFTVGATGGIYTITGADFAGQYEVTATATWDNADNAGSRILDILVNGAPVAQAQSVVQANGNQAIDVSQLAATMVTLADTDTISIQVTQDSAGAVTLNSTNLCIRHI